jgi:spermidine synthase
VLFALSGAAALAFQIAWVRLFSLVFGSSVYSFSAVLAVYLFGLALGSALVSRWMRRGVSLSGFARLELGLAVVAALMLFAFSRLPQWMFDLVARSGAGWGRLIAGEIGVTAAMLLVPCALLGAAFPIAARLMQRGDGGQAAGFAYAVNTAGTIAGSLAAGFLAVPVLGVQGTHVAALLLSLAIGCAALGVARARRELQGMDLVWALGAAAVVAIAIAGAPRWDPALMSTGIYRPTQASNLAIAAQAAPGTGSAVWRGSRRERVLFYREGVNGSVLVGSDPEGRERWLRVSGKIDASTTDMETQVLLGLIPAALADSGARTMIIGHGSGVTAAAALAAGAGPTEVLEIEPAVIEASRFFHGTGEDPLDDPRTKVVLGDARTHLAHGSGRYGLIISQPSNPWIAGINNLFTVDFYRKVKARLEPDGVFCQWMQTYELSPETFASLSASFLEVFGEGEVFSVWRAYDLLLVAAPHSRRLARERLETPAARRMLARARIDSTADLAGHYGDRLAALRPAGQGAPLNRDDRPIVEYRAPRDLIALSGTTQHGLPAVDQRVPFAERKPEGALYAAWPDAEWYEARARLVSAHGDPARAGLVVRGARAAGRADLAARLEEEIQAEQRHRRAAEEIENARALMGAGREAEGQQALERAAQIDPGNGRPWLMLADRRRLAGDSLGAREALARGQQSDDPVIRGEAAGMAGMMELNRRPRVAAGHFREAQRLSPDIPINYIFEARALDAAGDRAGAIAAVRRGLGFLPGDPQLTAMLAQLSR